MKIEDIARICYEASATHRLWDGGRHPLPKWRDIENPARYMAVEAVRREIAAPGCLFEEEEGYLTGGPGLLGHGNVGAEIKLFSALAAELKQFLPHDKWFRVEPGLLALVRGGRIGPTAYITATGPYTTPFTLFWAPAAPGVLYFATLQEAKDEVTRRVEEYEQMGLDVHQPDPRTEWKCEHPPTGDTVPAWSRWPAIAVLRQA